MAKQKAPAKLTGGGGFNYEDRVVARFLLDMLAGLRSLGPELGRVVRVDWQARDAGWLLDDLAVTLETTSVRRTAAFSVKSHRQITGAGFPSNFVEAVWEQRLHLTSTAFQEGRDLLGMVTGVIANDVYTAWEELLAEALLTPAERLVARLEKPANPTDGSQASEVKRKLFESLHCPATLLRPTGTDAVATVRAIHCLRVLHYDFDETPSRDEARAIGDCQHVLCSGSADEAERLWKRLQQVASVRRGAGGAITLAELVELFATSSACGITRTMLRTGRQG